MTPSFFARRWSGEVPVQVIFWRDMLLVGTLINAVVTFSALLLVAQGVDPLVAFGVHLLPLPYNLFLFMVVWNSPQSAVRKVVAAVWLAVMTLV